MLYEVITVAKLEKEHCEAVPLEIFNQLTKAEAWMQTQIERLNDLNPQEIGIGSELLA